MEVVLLEGPAQRQLSLDHKSKKVGPLQTLAKILIHLPDDWQTTITFYALSSMIQYHLCPYWARILSSKHQSCGFFFERHIILSICDVYFKGRWLTWFSHGEILSQHENQPIRCTNHGNWARTSCGRPQFPNALTAATSQPPAEFKKVKGWIAKKEIL